MAERLPFCPYYRILGIKFPGTELIDHLVKTIVYFAYLWGTQTLYSKPFRNVLNLSCWNSVQPAFLHNLNKSLFATFLLCYEERNVTSLSYFGNRKINCSEPCIKTTDSVTTSITSAGFRMNPFFSSCPVSNFDFPELVLYPLDLLLLQNPVVYFGKM